MPCGLRPAAGGCILRRLTPKLCCATLRDAALRRWPLEAYPVGPTMASSSSDDGGGSDVADFVELFELDSDDGELPQPRAPEPEPEPEPEPGATATATATAGDAAPDASAQLAAQLQRWLPRRAGQPCPHAPAVVSVQQAGLRCTGGWVWEGARELDTYLLHSVESFAGLRVLELGAGVGWLAQRLASLGARVVATEQAAMLPTLQLNIAKATAQAGRPVPAVDAAELDWLEVEQEHTATTVGEDGQDVPAVVALTRQVGGWDLIVGSDCVYMQEFFGAAPLPPSLTLRLFCASPLLRCDRRR